MIKQRSGHILFTSSIQGKIAIPFRSAYTASKHALEAWCDSARAELHTTNVKITVVSPGYINTALSVNALTGSGHQYGGLSNLILAFKYNNQILLVIVNLTIIIYFSSDG